MERQLAKLCEGFEFFDFSTVWKSSTKSGMLCYALQLLGWTINNHTHSECKATPGSKDWPSNNEWVKLNNSISGRLLKPPPPGAVCHQGQPTFDSAACPAVAAGWLTSEWQADNPVGTVCNNFNNDTCLPDPNAPCSGEGYPIYVVNATSAEDVKQGVDFARRNHIRLVVKGTGHDYIGRSVAPNSLSIWTHHISGVSFQDGFKPKGCRFTIDGPAVTAGAGTQMLEINYEAHLRNLMVVSGGGGTVGLGGFLTAGGHSALSSTYGLAADQVLEMEMVTPGGEILTINECQSTDLFWAMRGGGGSTFGVMTSVTFRAFQAVPFITASGFIGTLTGSNAVWDVVANVLSQYPALDAQGIMAYSWVVHDFSLSSEGIPISIDGVLGQWILPALHPDNTSDSLHNAISGVFREATAGYFPGRFFRLLSTHTWPDFWAYYNVSNGPRDAGFDLYLGSRLLDGEALTQDLTALKEAFRTATPPGRVTSAYLVGGHGVQNAKPRGGSNAVNPVWRKSYVHSVLDVKWQPFDNAQKVQQADLLNDVYIEALRRLAPETGAYVNEAYKYEPNFQETFWGSNYPRLLEIKRQYDPDDVFWCQPCVGNERWEEVDDMLCRV